MHFYHMYIVEADDIQSAYSEVESRLEHYQHDVWDYYHVLNDDQEKSIHEITKDNWEELFAKAEIKMGYTEEHYQEYKQRLIDKMKKENIISFDELKVGDNSMLGFYLRRIGGLVASYFSNDTFFFNWKEECPLITKEEFEKYANEGGHYVVLMDLHN